jgi:UDP-glucose 4-epimerase
MGRTTYPIDSALVTGGAGFIGSNLATELAEANVDVVVLDNMSEHGGANPANLDRSNENLTLIEGDVRDAELVRDLVEQIDTIFHLAALLSRPRSLKHPKENLDVNCNGTLTVLEAARRSPTETQLVFAGSQAEFGVPETLPLTEDAPTHPVDMYGVNKLAAEYYCNVYRDTHGIDATTLRLTNVYGPKADIQTSNYGVLGKFIRLALEDEELTVFEPGDMRRDPIFVEDVVNAFISVAETPSSTRDSGCYMIGSGDPTTVKELAETIVATVGAGSVEMTPWPDDWDSIRVGDLYADATLARDELNWAPTASLADGIERTAEFYRRNWDAYLGT